MAALASGSGLVSAARYDGLGFDIAPRQGGAVAVFRCNKCPEEMSVRVGAGARMSPEALAKRAVASGWDAHPFRKSYARCPACNAPSEKHDPDSELKRIAPMAPPPTKPGNDYRGTITVNPPPAQPPPAPAAPRPAPVVALRDPDPEQRVAIRRLLDEHFDDSAGMYLEGFDDGRIAELVGVPRVAVERLREAAYGPIRVDAMTLALRTEANAAKEAVEAQAKEIEKLRARVAELSSKVERMIADKAHAA